MKKIGIIGCGVIGKAIAQFIQDNLKKKARVVAISDLDIGKAVTLSRRIKPKPPITNIDHLIEKSDLVIEAASPSISGAIAKKAIAHKKDVLIMSTGGLLKSPSIIKKARLRGCNVYIPSGAICGLDGLVSAGIGKINGVKLTTRKPPEGFKGAPYLKKNRIDINKIKKEVLLFKGTAKEAIKYFPQNINVSATLSLLGIGPDKTEVAIITSPEYTKNIHEVEVEGEFGRLFARTENIPSKENPKTSQLAVYSALAKLKEIL